MFNFQLENKTGILGVCVCVCILLLCIFVLLVGFLVLLQSSFAVTFICKWWQFFTCVHYFIHRKCFFFSIFRFIMYIAVCYLHFVQLFLLPFFFVFFFLLFVNLHMPRKHKIHKIVHDELCVFDGRDWDKFLGKNCPLSHSTNPKRNENQKYCHWFSLISLV